MKIQLPVGFQDFHRKQFFNYQINRWYSEGYARLEDLRKAAAGIRTFKDYINAFLRAAKEAEADGRLENAASYYRAAEFLVKPSDPDKLPLYRKFLTVFDEAFKEDGIQRVGVPYGNGFLPVMRLVPEGGKKGSILIHIGFDSLIEEFYCISKAFSESGYEVYAFDGPGQGGALRLHGIVSDHAWEKPVKAILDFFALRETAILGVSMGGYWCLRAAAFEKRIKQVIAFPPLFDWMETESAFIKKMVDGMMKRERFMRWAVRMKMKAPLMEHVVSNTLFITGKTDILDAVRWELAMNKDFLRSDLVDQDVLLVAGEEDRFQSPVLYHKQREALTNAKSVTGRIFTRADGCPHHCGIGNLGLVIEYMIQWLDGKILRA